MNMERLTKRDENGNAHYPYCYEKCDGDGIGIRCQTCDFEEKICNKLADYEDLEAQGLLLKLPCKIGDVVWFVGNKYVNDYEIRRFVVDNTEIAAVQVAKTIEGRDYWNSFSICDFGKTVFLTEQEAQAALEKMEG